MKQAFIYSIKVWATTMLLSPIIGAAIIGLLGLFDEKDFSWDLMNFTIFDTKRYVLESYIYLPLCLILWLVVWTVNRTRQDLKTKKRTLAFAGPIIFNGLSIVLIGVTIYNAPYLIAYGAVSILAIMFYDLKPANNDPTRIANQQ